MLCGACSKPDYCMVNEDSTEFLCMRVSSSKPIPLRDGTVGYVHKADGAPVEYIPQPKAEKPLVDINAAYFGMLQRTKSEWQEKLAAQLGVSFSAVRAMGAAWYSSKQAWAFPMRNGVGKVVGIRLRSENGHKWAMPGSSNALFIPDDDYTEQHVYAVEGPTDCMAGFTIGLKVIGRFNNCGGLGDLLDFITHHRVKKMVIIADNDEVKVDKKTGARRYPGTEGAEALSANLPIFTLTLTLPTKDLRAFVKMGGTARMLKALEQSMEWRKPTWLR